MPNSFALVLVSVRLRHKKSAIASTVILGAKVRKSAMSIALHSFLELRFDCSSLAVNGFATRIARVIHSASDQSSIAQHRRPPSFVLVRIGPRLSHRQGAKCTDKLNRVAGRQGSAAQVIAAPARDVRAAPRLHADIGKIPAARSAIVAPHAGY